MTKQEITQLTLDTFGEENGPAFVSIVLDLVREEIKRYDTSWQVTQLSFRPVGRKIKTEYTRCGYRKYTTGEYVPNAYLGNFGWKNTYYQNAALTIDVPEQEIVDRFNDAL